MHVLLHDYIEMILLIWYKLKKSFHLKEFSPLSKTSKINSKLQKTIHFYCLLLISCLRVQSIKVYPILQMSMAGPYLSSPSSSSGGLYQSVITLFVYSLSLSSASYRRASPQSPSFIWPLKQITLSYRDGRRLKAMKAGTSIFFLVVKNLAKIGHKFETISIMLITFPFFFFILYDYLC